MHQPSNINDTVMFLAIARAMSVTLDVDGCSEYRSRFSSDLSRWQILFTGQSLEDFSHTVKYIWRVTTLDSGRSNTPDQANSSWVPSRIGCENCEQSRDLFRPRTKREAWTFRKPGEVAPQHSSKHNICRRRLTARRSNLTLEKMPEHCVYAWDSGGGNPTLRGYGSRCTLIDEIRSDPAVPLISTIVVLMASAIFSIVLFRYVIQVSGLDQASSCD